MANNLIVGILRAILTADTAEFETALDRASNSAAKLGKDLTRFGSQTSQLGGVLTRVLTVPLAAFGTVAAKAAIDFESSFAGVRKTVDATDAEFKQMEQGFRDLAKSIPVNVNELNRLGEAAGALGIPKKDIVEFARVMAELGVTTNLTADQAADSVARIQNIFGAAGKDTERFASTLVALGNAGASTESDILEMAKRIAGAGHTVGLTQAQVLAFGSALSSVGIEAEAGGTAISRVFINIAGAASKGGSAVAGFAKVAGMSGREFAQAFKDDAAGATAAFIEGLGRIQKAGGDLFGTLDALGLSEIRVRDALLRAAGAGDLLRKSLDLSGDAWKDNNALLTEAGERFKTTESRLLLLWNRLKDVAITLGNALLPLINSTITAVTTFTPLLERMAEGFRQIPGPIQAMLVGLGGLAALAGPALVVIGQISIALGGLTKLFGTAAAGSGIFGTAIGALAGPVAATLAVIVGAGGLIVGLIAATGHWNEFTGALKGGWEVLTETVGLIGDLAKITLRPIVEEAKAWARALGLVKDAIDNTLIPSVDAGRAATERYAFSMAKAGMATQDSGSFFLKTIRAWREALNGANATLASHAQIITGVVIPAANGLTAALQRDRQAQQDAWEETDKHRKAIKALGDELSGAAAIKAARDLAEAFEALPKAVKEAPDVLKRTGEAIEHLKISFDKLPPSLQAVAVPTQKVIDGLSKIPGISDPVVRSFNDIESAAIRAGIPLREFGVVIGQLGQDLGQSIFDINKWIKSLPTFKELAPPKGLLDGWESLLRTELPQTILRAFEGGGDALKSIGAAAGQMLATNFVEKFGNSIKGLFGNVLGGIFNNLIPGLGSLLGPLIGKIGDFFKNLFGGPSKEELAGRQAANAFRNELIEGLSDEQKAQARTQQNVRWASEVIAIRDAYIAAGRTEQEALSASRRLWEAEKQGPEAVRRVIEEISAVMKAHKDDFAGPAKEAVFDWQKAQEAAARYGIEIGALGDKFQGAKITADAQQILDDFNLLVESGADVGGTLFGMREEISAVVRESIRLGEALPAAMHDIVMELARSGNLLDENGNAITDLSAVRFTEVKADTDDWADRLKHLLDGTEDGMKLLDDAADGVADTLNNTPWEDWASRAAEAGRIAEEAMTAVALGHSPGGIKEIPIQLNKARTTLHDFGREAGLSYGQQEQAINAIVQALGSYQVGTDSDPLGFQRLRVDVDGATQRIEMLGLKAGLSLAQIHGIATELGLRLGVLQRTPLPIEMFRVDYAPSPRKLPKMKLGGLHETFAVDYAPHPSISGLRSEVPPAFRVDAPIDYHDGGVTLQIMGNADRDVIDYAITQLNANRKGARTRFREALGIRR